MFLDLQTPSEKVCGPPSLPKSPSEEVFGSLDGCRKSVLDQMNKIYSIHSYCFISTPKEIEQHEQTGTSA